VVQEVEVEADLIEEIACVIIVIDMGTLKGIVDSKDVIIKGC